MKGLIIIIVCTIVALSLLIIKRIRNLKNQSESKLSIFEHPSTFEKPPIEMTTSNPKEEDFSQTLIIQNSKSEKSVD